MASRTTAPAATEPARHRAASLPPDERRAAIIDATIPLLLEHGATVTTRQIAEAAGIAEGTIFRVFPDKDSLIQAAVETAFDPAPVKEAIRGIDLTLPLEDRLERAVRIIQQRSTHIWELMSAVGPAHLPADLRAKGGKHKGADLETLANLFKPDRDQLRRTPMASAQLLRGLTLAGTHPALIIDKPLTPTEIVSVLLDGIRTPC